MIIKSKFFFLAIIFFAIFGWAEDSWAAENHYINSEKCLAGNLGASWDDAVCDLNNFTNLTRGDTYYIADGDYGAYIFDDAVDGDKYIYVKKATVDEHGSDVGWLNEFGDGQAVFKKDGGITPENIIAFRTNYYEFDGAKGGGPSSWKYGHGFKIITNNPKATLLHITHNGVNTNVAGNIKVYHSELAHVGAQGNPFAINSYGPLAISTKSTGGNYSLGNNHFAYNYIHDSPVMLFWGYMPGSFIFEYNFLDTSTSYYTTNSTVQGSGITTYGGKGQIYRYNVFKDMEGSCGICLYTWHGDLTVDDILIYSNLFYYSSAYNRPGQFVQNGIIATDGCQNNCNNERAINIKILGNTFANIKGNKLAWIDSGTSGNIIKNNIFYSSEGVSLSSGEFKGFTHDYNFFFNNTDYRDIISPLTFIDSNLAGDELNSQIGTSDPFIDSLNENFHIGENSQARDVGIYLGSPYDIDPDGNIRGTDGNWDIGAYEYNEATTPDLTPPSAPSGLSVR